MILSRSRSRNLGILALSLCVGCAPSILEEGDEDESSATPSAALDEGAVRHLEEAGGLQLTEVDATSNEVWIYLDLDTGLEVDPEDSEGAAQWDLAFQRFVIAINGGVSGEGSVEVAVVEGSGLESLTQAPAEGYRVDEADGDDENTGPDRVFDSWYSYDPSTHILTPAALRYVVFTSDGNYVKLEMAGYYDEAGTSAFPSFWWGPVEGP